MSNAIYSMPMLCQVAPGKFILIHEADVMHSYSAASLNKTDTTSFSVFIKYPKYNHYDRNYKDTYEAILEKESSEVIAAPGLKTPWRVILIGNNLKPIVESTLIEALCPPAQTGDYSWINPGVAVFPWWGNNLANGDTNALKSYIDMAAEMNWKFIEFDVSLIGSGGYAIEQWRTTPWIKRVVDYAASKNVSVYGWDERRNLDTPEKRADIFGIYRNFGIKGIKIDFINSTKQEAMAFRESCLQDALKYKLLVSFHGDYPPRGERRTYPNIATQEGVKGAEYYLFAPDTEIPTPEHNCTLPYTRNIVGPMDYTPVAFSHPRRVTTYAHELAMSVVVESGWLCMCDKPEFYLNSPAAEFLKKLVSVWDETIFLDGYPGEYFCIARRSGNDWYVAGINAGEERKVSLNLDFVEHGVSYLKIYSDGENARGRCTLLDSNFSPDHPLEILMAENGGFAFTLSVKAIKDSLSF
jgi:alpha-glucosidase